MKTKDSASIEAFEKWLDEICIFPGVHLPTVFKSCWQAALEARDKEWQVIVEDIRQKCIAEIHASKPELEKMQMDAYDLGVKDALKSFRLPEKKSENPTCSQTTFYARGFNDALNSIKRMNGLDDAPA